MSTPINAIVLTILPTTGFVKLNIIIQSHEVSLWWVKHCIELQLLAAMTLVCSVMQNSISSCSYSYMYSINLVYTANNSVQSLAFCMSYKMVMANGYLQVASWGAQLQSTIIYIIILLLWVKWNSSLHHFFWLLPSFWYNRLESSLIRL